jgi:hypothetical protein
MSKSEKSALARAQLEAMFAGIPSSDGRETEIPSDPFEEAGPSDVLASNVRLPVWLSNRIELRGYKNAETFMAQMASTWRLEWLKPEPGRLVARLPAGWPFYRKENGITEIFDGRGIARAISSIAEGDRSFLKVLPRYHVEVQKLWEIDGREDWCIEVHDRQHIGRFVYSAECSGDEQSLTRARNEVKAWLDENYPQHRDPFAYWSDCERNLL